MLGKYIGTKSPGWRIVLPVIQSMRKVDIRVKAVDVPDQEAITKDNISVKINAVIYYKVADAAKAVIEVEDFRYAISQLAQTTMRNATGEVSLDELLANRDQISTRIQSIVDRASDPWGIKVDNVELKDITLPEEMKRTIAKQAEAERERRLRIAAEARIRADRQRAEAKKAWEAKQREKLIRAAERDEARAEEHEAKARAIVPNIVPKPETPQGVVMAEVWDYEVVDQDKLLEAAATSHPHLRALFTIDRAALKRQVLATKDTMPIPGVRVFKRLQAKSKGV